MFFCPNPRMFENFFSPFIIPQMNLNLVLTMVVKNEILRLRRKTMNDALRVTNIRIFIKSQPEMTHALARLLSLKTLAAEKLFRNISPLFARGFFVTEARK